MSSGIARGQKSCFRGGQNVLQSPVYQTGAGRQRPVDLRLLMRLKILIGLGKVSATQEAAVRRQGRWVRRLENTMATGVDQPTLRLRIRTPQQEHQSLAVSIQRIDHPVREPFPTLALVRARN